MADKEQAAADKLAAEALAWRKSLPAPAACPARSQGPTRPNILLIMSDDMGFSDLGCYGGEIHTPNLDALAQNGLRFTQFYNTCRCCPTRASLLTGLYSAPGRRGAHDGRSSGRDDGYPGDLNRRCVTIAEALRPAGYRTYMCGKWHVTKRDRPRGPEIQLAAAARLRPLLRHDHGRRQLLTIPTTLCRRQHVHHARERSRIQAGALLLHRRHQRQRRAVHPAARGEPPEQAVLHVRRLHRRALADARAGRRTSPSTRASTTAATSPSATRASSGSRSWG